MADRQKITFHQEGDQVPGLEPGDIVIVLDQKEHPVFQRRGNDLVVQKEIPLVDALCGCRQIVHTLDQRQLLVSSRPGGRRAQAHWALKRWHEGGCPGSGGSGGGVGLRSTEQPPWVPSERQKGGIKIS